MASPVVFAVATGIGLLTDKYMLEATNYVEHYAADMRPTPQQSEFIKCAMYAGAIFGMVTMGPVSDFIGRRASLIACSVVTLAGALLSAGAWSAHALIAARILTGVGMGGEYPLASTHSAESSEGSGNGARNVALLYLFGNGLGPVLCSLVTYCLDLSGLPGHIVWRLIFAVGALLSLCGLVLRYFTTKNAKNLAKVHNPKGTRRNFVRHYWRPLFGTSLIWLLFDVVEYGLKQNDAAIFAESEGGPYRNSVLMVLCQRLLSIPSLAFAPWLLTKIRSKRVQMLGFAGCMCANLTLALGYSELKGITLLFNAVYLVQLSFQSLPGVTTLAISAEIFPTVVKGTGAGISAASGKIGATLGSYLFTLLQEQGHVSAIFWTVAATSAAAVVATALLTPGYNGATLAHAEELAHDGRLREAVRALYRGPQAPPRQEAKCDAQDMAEIENASTTASE
uniref:Major facilitator superfamily (MFS) profile domain-containing protein n=1 Tax=Zooxanthella nutricula TaxID=1333877 RepID=A0A7S2NYW5_9DINO